MAQEEKDKTKEEEKTEEIQENTVEETKQEVTEEVTDVEEEKEEVEEESGENVAEEESEPSTSDQEIPDFRVGDTIKVFYKIIEGDKVRTQPYQGIVISKKGTDLSRTFTVRKIGADNIGVERIFPLHSPNIEKIKIMRRGKVRRAKLYYLRGRVGRKATQIKDRPQSK